MVDPKGLEVGTAGCSLGEHVWPMPPLLWVREADNQTFISNGSWRESDTSAEFLCHAIAATEGGSSTTRRQLPAYAKAPHSSNTPSETEGTSEFDLDGAVPNNLRPAADSYVRRPGVEAELREILSDTAKRHLVNMKGIGGIGKTSLIMRMAHELIEDQDCPYEQVVWVSSRDVDLTLKGPKAVRKGQDNVESVWKLYAELWESDDQDSRADFEAAVGAGGTSTLLIMDNFETFSSEEEAYAYLDTVVHPPSKVVITSRHDFKGDYQVQVRGMERDEAAALIRTTARSAGREGLVDDQVIARIFDRCEGHPYAMKLLAASVESKVGLENVLGKVFRDEGLLEALFRESAAGVGEEAEFVFLLASRFPRGVSELALRIAAEHEDIDLKAAISALLKRSLIEVDPKTGLYSMPAMAREFAARLGTGHIQAFAVEDAERYVKSWRGLTEGSELVGRAMELAVAGGETVRSGRRTVGTLSIVAEYNSRAWASVARAIVAEHGDPNAVDDAYKRAVEASPDASHLYFEWSEVVRDTDHAIQLKVQAVTSDPANFVLASRVARVLNSLKARDRDQYPKVKWVSLMEPVARILEANLDRLDAADCSSLAWLYLNLGNPSRAKHVVTRGLTVDDQNPAIQKLAKTLNIEVAEVELDAVR
ncbi:MAG: NB-ARC domain-containing protein [Solirubrobacterales bacterium]